MGSLALPFVILPCAGGVAAAYWLRDWRLAGATAAGALAMLFLLSSGAVPLAVFALPVLAGVAAGALALVPYLYMWPAASVWSRMTLGLGAALAAGLALLIFSTGRA